MIRPAVNVPSVSLVPAACCRARARDQHARAWALAVLAASLILAGLFATRVTSRQAVGELASRLAYAETGRSAIQQQLALARRDQQTLSARMLVLAGLVRDQHWARRLAALLAAAPDEIVLTGLRLEPVGDAAPAEKPAAASAPATTAARETLRPAAAPRPVQLVRVSGQAGSNEVLQRFVSALRESGAWAAVSMQQLTVVEGAAAGWLTFELECRPREIDP